MGWSRSGCFALRSQTLLRMWIAATTCISEAIWKRSTGKDATSIIRELNLLDAVTCREAEGGKKSTAMQTVQPMKGAAVRTFRRTDADRCRTLCGSIQMLHRTSRAKHRNVTLSVIWGSLIFVATWAALQSLKHSRPPGAFFTFYQMVFCNFFKAVQTVNIMQACHHNFR